MCAYKFIQYIYIYSIYTYIYIYRRNVVILKPRKTLTTWNLLAMYFTFEQHRTIVASVVTKGINIICCICGTAIYPTSSTRGPTHELVLHTTVDLFLELLVVQLRPEQNHEDLLQHSRSNASKGKL